MKRRRWQVTRPPILESRTHVRVRFQEVDSLRVVWHGHYLTYLEEGRQAFGREYGLSYESILERGYVVPLVHVALDYIHAARLSEKLEVVTRMHDEAGAKVVFTYEILGETGGRLATGVSFQCFADPEGDLVLVRPPFFEEFLARHRGAREPV